jgi:hypothetical protein
MPDAFECVWCYGTAVDEEGCICVVCNGTLRVSWEFVKQMGVEGRYPLADRIRGAATHPLVKS